LRSLVTGPTVDAVTLSRNASRYSAVVQPCRVDEVAAADHSIPATAEVALHALAVRTHLTTGAQYGSPLAS
jgi:hypothetical protein